MNLYEKFATNEDAERTGIVLDLGEGVTITVRRAGGRNAAYQRVLEAKVKPYRRQIDLGTLDPELNRRLIIEAYAEAVVLGWSGVTDRAGKALAFSRDNFIKVMSDLPDLFGVIVDEAGRAANFRAAEIEETAAVLGKGSSGTSSGAKA